jgi:dihydrolipoamide dehydrogenase
MGVSVHYLCKSRPKSWITVASGSGPRATSGPDVDPAVIGDKMLAGATAIRDVPT